ncbi:type IV pilus modification PilV family protein [Photobacterium marinum]|uniref:type IV pilus modification PilV family protein n=1 Tax=Photobacterium marinum TaxID=1056511 RepID=UPI001E2B0944|nr:prepilin-type N-terminal cleavage/methylation domain-containing protein [Photobacterium marinum]
MNWSRHQKGFTLIEGIIAIVVMGIAMVTLTSFLFPQVERSAEPHYQARAAALANALMTEILARKFDQNSDDNGGRSRCDDTAHPDLPTEIPLSCSTVLGVEKVNGADESRIQLDDVDDYIGCWSGNNRSCTKGARGNIEDVLGDDVAPPYSNFTVTVAIFYDPALDNTPATVEQIRNKANRIHKRINLTVDAGRYGSYQFSAYRSNY